MTIILLIGLAIWIGATVMKSDKLISNIHKRLDEIEKRLKI